MRYLRLFVDDAGETHLEDVAVPLSSVEFAPPAPPLDLSAYHAADRYAFCRFPAGWHGDWHPTPRRQVFFLLAGEMEVEVSDGEVRHIGPGTIVLVEDTHGRGHVSRVVGPQDVLSAVVQLPD
jgi:mannose-6-phosphate isomerase-like protein (cupin superfamily)